LQVTLNYAARGIKVGGYSLNLIRIVGLASIGIAVAVEPAFAVVEAPGPVAGVGLPALLVVGGAYWIGRKMFGHKNKS